MRNRSILILALIAALFVAGPSFGQTKLGYFNSVTSNAGVPIQATITVYNVGTTTPATIYSDSAGLNVLANPFSTDSLGRFQFFAAAGNYDIQISGAGITTYKIGNQPLGYPGLGVSDSPIFVTVKLSGLTDGYIPYHVSDAVGLANSPIYSDGRNVYFGMGLTSAGGTVQVAPYNVAAAGAANFGPSTGQTSFEFIGVGHLYRIRQNGSVKQIKVYIPATTGITGFYFKVWRLNGAVYDLVSTSANLSGSLSVGVNTIAITPNLTAAEGDFMGIRILYSGGASVQNFYAVTVANTTIGEASHTYSVVNATPGATGYAWASQTDTSGKIVVEEAYMIAPIFVTIGDSITSGLTTSGAFTDNYQNATDVTAPYGYHLSHALGYTYQNVGIGSQITSDMAARFNSDVVLKSPKYVFILGGVNDIRTSINNTTIIASMTSMLDAAYVAGITPVVIGVTPFRAYGAATDAMLQQRDALNILLSGLVTGAPYYGFYVDPDPYIGQFYAGGDANNRWLLKAQYDIGDGLHLNPAGLSRIACAASITLNCMTFQGPVTVSNLNILGDVILSGDASKILEMDRNTLYQGVGEGFTIAAGGASIGGTDKNGGNLILQSGVSIGSGLSSILLQTSGPGSTGTTDNLLVTRATVGGSGLSMFDVDGMIRSVGANVPTTGIGAELYYNGGGYLVSRDRATGTYYPFTVLGSKISFGTGAGVAGQFVFQGVGIDNAWIGNNAYYDSGWKYVGNGYATLTYLNTSDGGWAVRSASLNSGGAGAAATFLNRILITNIGSVLIGGDNPAYTEQLSIIGAATHAGIYFNDQVPNTTTCTLYRSGNDLYWGATKLN